MTVLYAEDDSDILESVSEILEDLFDEVITATDGKEALALYNYHKNIDFLITDINMPQMNGLKLIEELRSIDKSLPVLVTTAYNKQDFLIKCIELKVDGFILKPIDAFELFSEVERLKERINTKKELRQNQKLLEEYKSAIDKSSIVSKANAKGIITFVNDAFCKISGYDREELIGKSHNIIRHPDTPSSVFKTIWENLRNKKSWKGVIKNRSKDGSSYYVDSYIRPIVNDDGEVTEYIGIRHDITELEKYRQDIEKELSIATKEIIDTQKEVVYTMGAIGETRSKETGQHVKRVAEYSYLLAILYGLDEHEASILKQASPMHDIGKVGIPDNILNKPGKLEKEEFEVMKSHSLLGYEMLKHSNKEILKAAAVVAFEHHEKWDGTGYPRGLKGDEIHIFGRITAIADVFDALGHDRVYKKAWPLENILNLFKEGSGKHFDPNLINIFFDNLDKFLEIKEELS